MTPSKSPENSAPEIGAALGAAVYAESVSALSGGAALFMARRESGGKLVGLAWPGKGRAPAAAKDFAGDAATVGGFKVKSAPADAAAAALLRKHLPCLKPKLLGLTTSLGLGDRLGIATPGHVRAVRGTGLSPIFAQQSIREMTRTVRTPQEVMDAASLGAFQAGWREGFGSDADHLKTVADAERCLAVGFTMFTVDPGDHVDGSADRLTGAELSAKFDALPWKDLESSAADCRRLYAGKSVALDGGPKCGLSEEALLRAAVKYGRAVAHVGSMYRNLVAKAGVGRFELEVSVDETDSPTSVAEHYYVAAELKRLGVGWVSLAPRFVGRFEKGVDYIGDPGELRSALIGHAAVARTVGPYKLSIHSGSDKFSVYPLAAEAARGLVHVKTAGTSYLEALRTLAAGADRGLFREILAFARERYEEDRKSYHVSADLAKVLRPEALKDADLPAALDQFDTREALHVTFGSVLNTGDFKARLMRALSASEELHYEMLRRHLGRHAAPFAARGAEGRE